MRKAHNSKRNIQQLQRYNLAQAMSRVKGEFICNELLDDIDFYYNKVKCRKIERMLPALSKLVIEEQNNFAKQHPSVL